MDNSITSDRMPANKRTKGGQSSWSSDPEKDDPAYQLKRQRNNDAVRKARAKSKETANKRKENVEKLKQENHKLEIELESTRKSIDCLKGLLLKSMPEDDAKKKIKEIIESKSDEE